MFHVKTGCLHVLLDSNIKGSFIKLGDNLPITLEVFNNTSESRNALELSLVSVSSSGTEVLLYSQSIDLAVAEKVSIPYVFSPSQSGVRRLKAILKNIGNGSGEQPGMSVENVGMQAGDGGIGAVAAVAQILSEMEMVVQVVEPSVIVDWDVPLVAGHEPFDGGVILCNNGIIALNLQVRVVANGSSQVIIDQPLERYLY